MAWNETSRDRAAWHRSALMAVCLLTGFALTRGRTADPDDAVLARIAAIHAYRNVEPRLSVDLAPLEFRPAEKTEFSALARKDSDLAKDVAWIARRSDTTKDFRSAGIAHLLLSDWDKAIEKLENARRRDPAVESAIDLAAAYYMRGAATKSLDDFARALQNLGRAPASPVTVFNRALILEQLCDWEGAALEWNRYLELDPGSAWSDEARKHLRRPAASAVSWTAAKPQLLDAAGRGDLKSVAAQIEPFRFDVRRLLEIELLPRWGELVLAGKTDLAAKELATAAVLARHLQTLTGERLLPDVIEHIERSPAVARTVAQGFVRYGAGRRAGLSSEYATALGELRGAERAFSATGSPATALAGSQIVAMLYYLYDYPAATREREALAATYKERSYLAFEAHLAVLEGNLETVQGNPSRGLLAFQKALSLYERLGEKQSMASQHTNLADTLQYLGDFERASVHRYHALALSDSLNDPRRLHPILSEAADAALAAGMPEAALAFHDRLVRVAERGGDALQIATSHVTRSIIHRHNGDHASALNDLREARRYAFQITDTASRDRVFADIGGAEAFVHLGVDDRRAVESLNAPLDFFKRVGFRMQLAQLLLERGRARLRLGETAAAEEDFRTGVAELESQRTNVDNAEHRITYFDRAESLFTDLGQTLLQRGREEEAFDIFERSRARALLDTSIDRTPRPLPARAIQQGLDRATTLVTLTLTGDSLITSVVTSQSLQVREQAIDAEALEQAIDDISRGFDSREGLPAGQLRQLAGVVLSGIEAVAVDAPIVFVPDRTLARIPFAALPWRGRFLIETHPLTISPSATVFVENARRDRRLMRGAPSALVIAMSEPPEGFESLRPLTHVAGEAGNIGRLYGGSRVVLDSATAVDLLDGGDYDIIHFAGHAVVDPRDPASSVLLIGKRERLRASEIEARRFQRTRLVVLGACGTALGKAHRSEGIVSLARSFMVAGVPVVVGTLAPVEDGAAASLLSEFHAQYARGADAARALQAAQVAMIQSKNPEHRAPERWAAFEVMGGNHRSE